MRIAVTSRSFSRNRILRQALSDRYQQVTFNETGKILEGEELIRFLQGHQRAIIGLEKIDAPLLEMLPDLEVISRFGVGIDTIDINTLHQRGIKLAYTAGVNKRAVSELVIALALTMLRRLPAANQMVKSGQWGSFPGRQLSDRTLGIIGLGAIGKDLAILAKAFNCSLIAFDQVIQETFCKTHGILQMELNALLSSADIISLHLPLNKQTRHLLNAECLCLMKQDAILVNTARGGLVDEIALKHQLQNPSFSAAFDVFDIEPPVDQTLLSLPNFFATPHIAGSTEETILAIGHAAIEGLKTAVVPHPSLF